MSKKKQLLIQEIERRYNDGEITLGESNSERERINNMTFEEISNEAEGIKGKLFQNKENSFEDTHLKVLKSIDRNTRKTNGWVTFLGIVIIINILIQIIVAANLM
ncbi:hypothetical protein N9D26_00210 [bacterium]|nr:hypothetical protein [bacterium]